MAEWTTSITRVEPNNIRVSGYPLQQLVEKKNLLEVAFLLVNGELPEPPESQSISKTALGASSVPATHIEAAPGDDISKTIAAYLLTDLGLVQYPNDNPQEKTAYALGRAVRYIANIYGNGTALDSGPHTFSQAISLAFTGKAGSEERLLEAMITACVDHGVTPPSAQATRIAASVRASYEVAVAHGVGAITDVHGGAGAKAAGFFKSIDKSYSGDLGGAIEDYSAQKKRIPGLGHRVHKNDPRRDVLWKMAKESGVSGPCVEYSMKIGGIFREKTGKDLPINVDGIIGAIVADLGLDDSAAKAIFILGRIAGLSAHYYEEVNTQPRMRRINFSEAEYAGPGERSVK